MKAECTNPLQFALERIKHNPLLAAIPEHMPLQQLARAMRYRPITPENVQEIDRDDRLKLIDIYKKVFIPTTQNLAIAQSLLQMIRNGLAQRDPHQANARSFIYQGGLLKGQDVSKLEWWPTFASGMVIEGITGTGKSQLMARFLSLVSSSKLSHPKSMYPLRKSPTNSPGAAPLAESFMTNNSRAPMKKRICPLLIR